MLTLIDFMFYAALAIVIAAGAGILFIGGWLIHRIVEERERSQ